MKTLPRIAEGDETHIASQVVYVNPAKCGEVVEKIALMEGVEIEKIAENGRLVVVMEAKNLGIITDRTDEISAMDGVINAVLVYHQTEETQLMDSHVEEAVAAEN